VSGPEQIAWDAALATRTGALPADLVALAKPLTVNLLSASVVAVVPAYVEVI
jgi:hypothetical protein